MKKTIFSVMAMLMAINCMAQAKLAFPFQGGKDVMVNFFRENLVASPDIVRRRATGTVIFKFTADQKGKITKMIIYYADDAILAPPIITALKKTNRKWIIPDGVDFTDFILPVSYSFYPPDTDTLAVKRAVYDFNQTRKPIVAIDQIPLNMATLLPAVMVNYSVAQ